MWTPNQTKVFAKTKYELSLKTTLHTPNGKTRKANATNQKIIMICLLVKKIYRRIMMDYKQ